MNQLQLATAIGQRLGVNCADPNSRDGAAVRQFMQLRHEQLWRAFLWKDSIIEYDLNIDTSPADYQVTNNYLPSKGNLVLPSIISHVLAARTSVNRLDIERPMVYYRVNPDEFNLSGTPIAFHLLSSCAWEFDVAQTLYVAALNAADNGIAVTLDEAQADGVSVVRNLIGANLSGAPAGNTDRLERIIKPQTAGNIIIGPKTGSNTYGSNLVPAGAVYNMGAEYFLNVILQPNTAYQITAGANELILSNVGGNPAVINLVAGQTYQFSTGAVVTGAIIGTNGSPGQPVTASVQALLPVAVITLGPNDLTAPMCQRIRFMPKPSVNTTLRILCKRKPALYASDTDEPAIAGFSGVLFALGYYDFCNRDERGGTGDAQAALNEAVGNQFLTPGQGQIFGKPGGFLAQLLGEETWQAAHESRIMPESGFGDPTYYGYDEQATKFW
jgi:hypothetical protein